MDRKELDNILQDHKIWLDEPDNEEYRANLAFTDLLDVDLRGADLRGAILVCADLRGADLRNADLRGTELHGADLRCANLKFADLRGAILRGADLRGANLWVADLDGALLQWADFRGADLRGADLRGAHTCEMKVNTETKIYYPMACPETGSFIAWKKADGHIVKLEIPEDAERSSATTNKCRSSKAKVLEIQNIDGTKADVTEIMNYRGFIYKVGEMVCSDKWDDNRWNECSHGIHFFMKRDEAVKW